MRSADTNVVVRYLLADDAEQFDRARAVIEREPIWLGITVILECEWVLRSVYGFDVADVGAALQRVMGLPTIRTENVREVVAALSWVGPGIEFADALHLARSQDRTGFVTFDERLAKKAPTFAPIPVTLL